MTKSQHSIFNRLCNEAFADDRFDRFTDAEIETLTELDIEYQRTNNLSESQYKVVSSLAIRLFIDL